MTALDVLVDGVRPKGIPKKALVGLYALLGFCFFSFNQGDLVLTASQSVSYLHGHILDFYDYNRVLGAVAYHPATYILFAIWGLPLKVFGLLPPEGQSLGLLTLYFKLLTTLVFFLTSGVLSRIALRLGFSEGARGLLVFAWLSSPLAIFSQFIFGQYDVFNVFFIVLGFYFFVSRRMWAFTIAFGAAMLFKNFALLVWAPLLLLEEKRLGKLVLHAIILVLPMALLSAPYKASPVFVQDVLGFAANRRIFFLAIDTGGWKFSVVFFLWFITCASAYLIETTNASVKELGRIGGYFAYLPIALLLASVLWHPQWMLLVVPFWALLTVAGYKPNFYWATEAFMALAVMIISVRSFEANVDQTMLGNGIWSLFNSAVGDPKQTYPILKTVFFKNGETEIWVALLNAAFVFFALTKFPWKTWGAWQPSAEMTWQAQGRAMQLRTYLVIAFFVLPCFLAYFRTL